jgi:FixJ family two-component response regulator
MGVKRFIRTHILEPVFGADNAAHVVDFAVSEVQHAVAVLKTTELGAQVAQIVKDVSAKDLSGAQKFEAALADVLPLAVSFLTTKGAIGLAVSEVEDVARELLQSTFNDVKSTTAGSLAGKILAIFGIHI